MDIYLLPTRNGGYGLFPRDWAPPLTERARGPVRDVGSLWRATRAQLGKLDRHRRRKEKLLRELGSAERVRVHYPASLDEADARRIYEELLEQQINKHRTWLKVDAVALPFSLPLSLIPGPNLVLFYLAWRTMSHYRGDKAGSLAKRLPVELVAEELGSQERVAKVGHRP